jgi:protein involved in ribonucleotide reduction
MSTKPVHAKHTTPTTRRKTKINEIVEFVLWGGISRITNRVKRGRKCRLEKRKVFALLITAVITATAITTPITPSILPTSTAHESQAPPTRNPTPKPPPQTAWNKTYGEPGPSAAFSVQQTSDDGYIVAGITYTGGQYPLGYGLASMSFLLVKVDSSGNQQWNKTYPGTGDFDACSIQQTRDGGYIIAGYTVYSGYTLPAGFPLQYHERGMLAGHDFLLVKVDSSGNQEWNKTYHEADDSQAYSVQQTSDGGYIVAGCTQNFSLVGSMSPRFWLVKVDSSGNQEWNKTYRGANDSVAYSVRQTSDGGYIVAGYTGYQGGEFNDLLYDFWLVKVDSSGNQEWNKTYGGALTEVAYSVRQTSDGGYIVAGYTRSFGAGWMDLWLVKVDSSGNLEWNETYDASSEDISGAYSVQQTSDGGYIVAGVTGTDGYGYGLIDGVRNGDFWLVKTVGNTTGGASSALGIPTIIVVAGVPVAVLVVVLVGAVFVRRKRSLTRAK